MMMRTTNATTSAFHPVITPQSPRGRPCSNDRLLRSYLLSRPMAHSTFQLFRRGLWMPSEMECGQWLTAATATMW